MKVIRRIIGIGMIVCIMLSNVAVTAKVKDESTDNEYVASATFGSKLILNGISDARMGTSTEITVSNQGSRDGWLLDSSKGTESSFIGINLERSIVSGNEDGSQYEVEVDYFDVDNLVFGLVYDAIDNSAKETDLVYYGKKKEWKTHTFVLDDACFSDRLDGFDFKIAIRTKRISKPYGSVTIGAVRVRKYTAKNPVQIISAVSNELGNIFANGEEKSFKISFKSYSNRHENVTVTYKAIDEYSSVKWQESESLILQPKSEVETAIEIDVKSYSLYNLVIEVLGEDFSYKKSVPFSFVNSTEDGSRNDRFGFNVHFQWAGYNARDGVEVIKKANVGFVRNTPEWHRFDPIDTPKGGLIFPEYFSNIVDVYKQSGLKLQVLFAYGNEKYGSNGIFVLPETDEQVEAYARYCAFVAKSLKERGVDVCAYEIWNEPNLTKYGGKNTTSDIYLKAAKKAATALREVDPDSKIAALAITSIYAENTYRDWYQKYLDTNADKYFDAISLHPYNYVSLPEDALINTIKKYKNLYDEKYKDSTNAKPFRLHSTEHGYRMQGITTTEMEQANYITRAYILLEAIHANDLYTMYEFSRLGGVDSDASHSMGAVQSCRATEAEVPYAAKSVFLAVANLNKQLQNAECTQALLETDTDYAYVFKRPKDNKNIITLWTTKEAKTVTFSLDTDEVVLYDAYGNAQVVRGNNGIFTFTASNSVSYVEGSFTNAETAKPVIITDCCDYTVASSDVINIKFDNVSCKTYDIEVEASDSLTLISIPKKIDDSAVMTVKVPDAVNRNAKVRVRFVQNGGTVQCIDINIYTTESISVSTYTYPTHKNSVKRWTGAVHITNYSTSSPLSGYFTIISPKEIADGMQKIRIQTIPAGSTGIVSFKFPKLKKLSMYKLKCRVETDIGEIHEFECDIDFSIALYAEKPPVIDGEANGEWIGQSAMISESTDQVYMSSGYIYYGLKDLSARTCIMYDEDNLYLYSMVQDDIHYGVDTGANTWKNDSIQFGLVFEQRIYDENIGGAFTQITLSDTPSGPVVWRSISENNELPIGEVNSAELVIKREGGYTYYELKLPWSEVKFNKPDFNVINKIGFSMLVNDNDGNGRKGWIAYADGIGKSKDTSLFTFLKILK